MRRLLLSAALLLLVVGLVPTALANDDGGSQTVTMVSGNGSPPGRDSFNEFSTDGGVTWDQAYIVDGHPAYANPIAGSEWISIDANGGFPVTPGLEVRYRRVFDLPRRCGAAALSVILHVDNDAGVFLNGVAFGSTPPGPIFSNFEDPPEGPFTTTGPFQKSGNLLEFRTNDQGVVTGLDYEATLTCARADDDDDDDPDDDDDDDDDGDKDKDDDDEDEGDEPDDD
jgi:hypothetical protein